MMMMTVTRLGRVTVMVMVSGNLLYFIKENVFVVKK
jgi:hypothetical protein